MRPPRRPKLVTLTAECGHMTTVEDMHQDTARARDCYDCRNERGEFDRFAPLLEQTSPTRVECAYCHAGILEPCRSATGKPVRPHSQRIAENVAQTESEQKRTKAKIAEGNPVQTALF